MDNHEEPWLFDENFNSVSDEFQFLDESKFFDFPLEDLEASGQAEDWNSLLLPSLDSFSTSLSAHCGRRVDSPKPPKYNFPEDKDTYKQASVSAKASPTNSILLEKGSSDVKPSKPPRTSSPISVLESGNSYSNLSAQAKRARSKRPRPSTMVNSWPTTDIISTVSPLDSDSSYAKAMVQLNQRKEKKKKKNLSQLSNSARMRKEWLQDTVGGKKCSHCEVTKTPQWREGPWGPKSLCNACGVRYRSGRLFPEYRPAASPTFVPLLHSNSHRKVTEMRNRATQVENEEIPLGNKSIPIRCPEFKVVLPHKMESRTISCILMQREVARLRPALCRNSFILTF